MKRAITGIFAAALAMSATAALAQSKPPLKLGGILDMSSLYADITGPGSEMAAKMAAEDFGGEVLGRKIEIIIDYGLTDIVAERYDAGVRSGELVAKDMIAVRIGPDMRMAVIGAPSYLRKRSEPKKPQDLISHSCINLRLPTRGGLYAWEFEKGGRELKVHVEGQLIFNNTYQMLKAALAGFGLAYVPEDLAQPHIAKRRLKRVLDDWCAPYAGFHLYYPSRHHHSPAFALLVDALRYRS